MGEVEAGETDAYHEAAALFQEPFSKSAVVAGAHFIHRSVQHLRIGYGKPQHAEKEQL